MPPPTWISRKRTGAPGAWIPISGRGHTSIRRRPSGSSGGMLLVLRHNQIKRWMDSSSIGKKTGKRPLLASPMKEPANLVQWAREMGDPQSCYLNDGLRKAIQLVFRQNKTGFEGLRKLRAMHVWIAARKFNIFWFDTIVNVITSMKLLPGKVYSSCDHFSACSPFSYAVRRSNHNRHRSMISFTLGFRGQMILMANHLILGNHINH